jgi:hypothetical protein
VHIVAEPKLDWHGLLTAIEVNGRPVQREAMSDWFVRLRQHAAISRSKSLFAAYAFLNLESTHEQWMYSNFHVLSFSANVLRKLIPEASQKLQLSLHYKQTMLSNLAANQMGPLRAAVPPPPKFSQN